MKEHRFGLRRNRGKSDTGKLAAQLAPLEEQDKDAARKQGATDISLESTRLEPGAIVVDIPRLPKGVVDEEQKKGFLGIEPVVLVILTLMLAFIAFIAWQVSGMPPNP